MMCSTLIKLVSGNRGDYAVRAVLHLAKQHGRERIKAQKITEARSIPRLYLARILAGLTRSGLLIAVAGPDGGYKLNRPPAKITLYEVFEAASEETALVQCIIRGSPCGKNGLCEMHTILLEAQNAMTRQLRKTTFADICKK